MATGGGAKALKDMKLQHASIAIAAIAAVLSSSGAALAASIMNADASAAVITIVEDGSRSEVVIEPGASETVCPKGCFLTLPNGDRIGLSGSENVEIHKGGALVK